MITEGFRSVESVGLASLASLFALFIKFHLRRWLRGKHFVHIQLKLCHINHRYSYVPLPSHLSVFVLFRHRPRMVRVRLQQSLDPYPTGELSSHVSSDISKI